MKAETKALIFLVVAILIISVIIIASFGKSLENEKNLEKERKASEECSTDVKTCPDGSQVSRIQPTCEFRPCLGSEKPT